MGILHFSLYPSESVCAHPTLEIVGLDSICRNPPGYRTYHLELGMVVVLARPPLQGRHGMEVARMVNLHFCVEI